MIEFNEDVEYILGRPNFQVARLAQHLMNKGLYKKVDKHKAEHEQAVAIHYMLNLYLKFGKKWREELKALEG